MQDVVAASAGDPDATHRLFTWLHPEMVRYCQARIRDRNAVHYSVPDLAQEICLAALRVLPGNGHDPGSFLAYVYGIAAKKILDQYRRTGAERTRATADLPTPDALTVMRAEVTPAMRLMNTLHPIQRQILLLRVVHGLSSAQTAQITGLAAATVRVIQHRALCKLRTQLAHDAGERQ